MNIQIQNWWQEQQEKSNEMLKKCIEWIISQQRYEKGFSPYPQTIQKSGTLATADVLSCLLRPTNGTYVKTYIDFLRNTPVKNKRLREEKSIAEWLFDAIKFLIEIRSEGHRNGGFPPLGDVMWIREVCFTDATADAVLGLFSALSFVQEVDPQREVEIVEENGTTSKKFLKIAIESRIQEGILWLWENRLKDNDNNGTYWTSGEGFPSNEPRILPTILSCLALDLYIDRVKEGNFPQLEENNSLSLISKGFSRNSTSELSQVCYSAIDWLANNVQKKGYLPFNPIKASQPSITNTARAITLFKHMIDRHSNDVDTNKLKNICEEAYKWLIEENGHKWSGTERDPIDLRGIQSKLFYPTLEEYDATYSRKQTVLILFLELYKIKDEINTNEEFKKGLDSLINEIVSNPYYCIEERIQKEPAISATAAAVLVFRQFLKEGFHIH